MNMQIRPAADQAARLPGHQAQLTWKMGFEIELLAPPGQSREALARQVAADIGGSLERFFHPQSEPSLVPNKPTFENLTPGFRVHTADGAPYASFVDDVTIKQTLDPYKPPQPGWYRIVSDDSRLLQLVVEHCRADEPLDTVLLPFAALFGTKLEKHQAGLVKVADRRNVSLAIGAPMPGERERPCEIVTAPLIVGQRETLDHLLTAARTAGYTVPREGAVHIHFDAAALSHPLPFSRLVELLSRHGPALRRLVGTNHHCVRLGGWPPMLEELVRHPDFVGLTWAEARDALREVGLTKYCDFNLVNMVEQNPQKPTFEVRILPSTLDAHSILEAATLFEAILNWCMVTAATGPKQIPTSLPHLISRIFHTPQDVELWMNKHLASDARHAETKGTRTSADVG